MSVASILQHRFVTRAILAGAVTVMAGVSLAAWMASHRRVIRCAENLQVLHTALMDYQAQAGHLPELAFFPDDAQLDPDSLYAELAVFGIQPSHCVCPSAPEPLRSTGITYVWNVALNGRVIEELAEPTWMLVEVHALSTSVHAPHRGTYNVLFSDGTVHSLRLPPAMP